MSEPKHRSVTEIAAEIMQLFAGTTGRQERTLRKLLHEIEAAKVQEVEDAERRGHHAATRACCETIEKVDPLYDIESVGNAVKLRKTLDDIGNACAWIAENCGNQETAKYLWEIVEKVKAALALPPRNCDVGTAVEQSERFNRFCTTHNDSAKCHCPCDRDLGACEFLWAQLPYNETPADADAPRAATEEDIEAGRAVWCADCAADCPDAGKDLLSVCKRYKKGEVRK